ncbi:MAG: hypothetical protein R3F62_21335 [Planctomycetota bacterium]
MSDPVQILRVGPVPGWPTSDRFLYVPVREPAGPGDMISAPGDTEGLDACRAAQPGVRFLCDPWMAPAQPDAEVATELSPRLRRTRADLSLAVRGEELLPPGRDQEFRRFFLANLGPFLIHPARLVLSTGGRLRFEATVAGGPSEPRTLVAELTLEVRPAEQIAFLAEYAGVVVEVVLGPPSTPLDFAELALADAYRLETVPTVTARTGELTDAAWSDLYFVLGLGFATVTGLERPAAKTGRAFDLTSGEHVEVVADLTFAFLPG